MGHWYLTRLDERHPTGTSSSGLLLPALGNLWVPGQLCNRRVARTFARIELLLRANGHAGRQD